MYPFGGSNIEVKLPVISVANTGNGPVRNFWPVGSVEQTSNFVAYAVNADIFPRAVAAELRQPSQRFPDCAASSQFPVFIPERVIT